MLAHDTDPAALAGLEIVDRNGERIGRVRQVYPDGGDLGWAGVRGNLIGTTEALVPLDRADLEDGVITLPITRARFLSAPRRTPDASMDDDERSLLRRFYDEDAEQRPAPAVVAVEDPEPAPAVEPQPERAAEPEPEPVEPEPEPEPQPEEEPEPEEEPVPAPVAARSHTGAVPEEQAVLPAPAAAAPVPAPASTGASDADAGIERSEQRIHVVTQPVPRTRVVLRKVVVTEQRTITVPVRREEIRLVREPIEDAEPVTDLSWSDAEQEFVLHEERVVVRTEVVPIERIRLVREVVQDQREVTGETWREQIVAGEEPV